MFQRYGWDLLQLMKTLQAIWVIATLLFTFTSHAVQTADARLHCWSLRFQRATAVDGIGFEWRLDLTTLSQGVNGELALDFFDSGYTHSSYVDLYYEWDEVTFSGATALDVPDAGDANGNGFPDFFEVSQPVNGLVSEGVFQCDPYFIGAALQATWYRDAGASMGFCQLSVPDPFSSFGRLTFVHTFELIEYKGQLTYTPGSNSVAGFLSLTQTNSGNQLNGPVVFERSAMDPFNELTLETAFLTNSSLQVLSLYTNTFFFRELAWPTNYFGSVELQDGDPATPEEDYFRWQLSLDDLNDADGDGIPDFSDDPAVAPPAPVSLHVALGITNVWITLQGEVGTLLEIQSAGTPLTPQWVTVRSLTLTNNPQTESLPRPAATTFWRGKVLAGQ